MSQQTPNRKFYGESDGNERRSPSLLVIQVASGRIVLRKLLYSTPTTSEMAPEARKATQTQNEHLNCRLSFRYGALALGAQLACFFRLKDT